MSALWDEDGRVAWELHASGWNWEQIGRELARPEHIAREMCERHGAVLAEQAQQDHPTLFDLP